MFEYQEIELPDNAVFKISPSQIDEFFKLPKVWYEKNVLGKKEYFQNTAMALGTVCHYIYEMFGQNKYIDKEYIDEQIDTLEGNPDIDTAHVKEMYRVIAPEVINSYISSNMPTHTEYQTYTEVKDNVYICGTIDAIGGNGSMVVDYKTVSKKPNDKAIPFNYKIQLLSYAYALKRNNHFIDRIRLVYGVKPTKTKEARTIVVTEQISYQDWKLVEDTLTLIADSVTKVKEQPELAYLIFKSMGLKEE